METTIYEGDDGGKVDLALAESLPTMQLLPEMFSTRELPTNGCWLKVSTSDCRLTRQWWLRLNKALHATEEDDFGLIKPCREERLRWGAVCCNVQAIKV